MGVSAVLVVGLNVVAEAEKLVSGLLDPLLLSMLVVVLTQARFNPVMVPRQNKQP